MAGPFASLYCAIFPSHHGSPYHKAVPGDPEFAEAITDICADGDARELDGRTMAGRKDSTYLQGLPRMVSNKYCSLSKTRGEFKNPQPASPFLPLVS